MGQPFWLSLIDKLDISIPVNFFNSLDYLILVRADYDAYIVNPRLNNVLNGIEEDGLIGYGDELLLLGVC